MPEIVVREIRPDEVDEAGRQRLEAYAQYEPDLSPGAWEVYRRDLLDVRANAEKGTVYVVEMDGRMVGSASVYWDLGEAETMFLTMMAVVPEARGAGAAEAIFARVVDHSREAGAKVLKWNTGHFMTPARRFYARLGYEVVEEQPFFEITLLTYRVPL